MRLLITTQVVDEAHPALGFFVDWIREFSTLCEHVTVVCLEAREVSFPDNVTVLSLGKDIGNTRFRRVIAFVMLLIRQRRAYDAVFVHMNPEYAVLGAFFWKLFRKRISLWYTHGSITIWLRVATRLVDRIFTASPESFPIQSPKVVVTGHGVLVPDQVISGAVHTPLRLVTVGRVDPVKHIETLIDVLSLLQKNGLTATLSVVGSPSRDGAYQEGLIARARMTESAVEWLGAVAHRDISTTLRMYDVFVSASGTGGLDKALLEALAVGLPVVTTSVAARSALATCGTGGSVDSSEAFADRLLELAREDCESRLQRAETERNYISTHHSLSILVRRIVSTL